jgi:hypothetical protein
LAQNVVGLLGTLFQNMLGGGSTGPEIEYRERSPLVVPPRSTLPPPQAPAAQRASNWPNDPDVARRRASEETGIFDGFIGRPRAQADGPRIRMSPNELSEGRVAGRPLESREPLGGRPSSVLDDNANAMLRIPQQQVREADARRRAAETELPVGAEPPRRLLTDPPQGLRASNQRLERLPETPVDRSDDLGVRRFQRQQSNR